MAASTAPTAFRGSPQVFTDLIRTLFSERLRSGGSLFLTLRYTSSSALTQLTIPYTEVYLLDKVNMSELKAGDNFPEGVWFSYIPPSPETSEFTTCGTPVPFNASQEFKNKKVVLVSIPGAFTPTCSGSHIPSYLEHVDKIKAKGVDQVIVIAVNDPFVMSGWAKANGITDDKILFMSDKDAKFSQTIGWNIGERTGRFAIIVDQGKVVYAARDEEPGSIEKSGALGVLAQL
ncbi:peroxiredoxin type-2 [Fusarium napiforme]|uniref:Thioredoxin peroxidase n=14 Tax=Fusarium TaxID=5506 RepID=A0A8H5J1P8_9HYPO|nr:peroxiredoxin type-2 [Fusarium napiforme]